MHHNTSHKGWPDGRGAPGGRGFGPAGKKMGPPLADGEGGPAGGTRAATLNEAFVGGQKAGKFYGWGPEFPGASLGGATRGAGFCADGGGPEQFRGPGCPGGRIRAGAANTGGGVGPADPRARGVQSKSLVFGMGTRARGSMGGGGGDRAGRHTGSFRGKYHRGAGPRLTRPHPEGRRCLPNPGPGLWGGNTRVTGRFSKTGPPCFGDPRRWGGAGGRRAGGMGQGEVCSAIRAVPASVGGTLSIPGGPRAPAEKNQPRSAWAARAAHPVTGRGKGGELPRPRGCSAPAGRGGGQF